MTHPSVIEQIGGAEAVRALTERFYDLVETLPEGEQILRLHLRGHGMAHVRQAQFDFLHGFFGGRRLYNETHGPMNLRDIHAHVPIRSQDAKDWLSCMQIALDDTGIDPAIGAQIMVTFTRAAQMLINQAP
ncbi:MAG: hypothetical protein RIR04_653 [Pseudomonadota bacterium]